MNLDKLIFKSYADAATLCELDEMVVGAFNKIWPFIGVALLFMFIYGGVMWLMSTGDPQKLNKAVSTLIWAFVGTLILAAIMMIMGVMEDLLGLPAGTFGTFEIC